MHKIKTPLIHTFAIGVLFLVILSLQSCPGSLTKDYLNKDGDSTRPWIEWSIYDSKTKWSKKTKGNVTLSMAETKGHIFIGDNLTIECKANDEESGIKSFVVHCNFSPICVESGADIMPETTQDILPSQEYKNPEDKGVNTEEAKSFAILPFSFKTEHGKCVGATSQTGVRYSFKGSAENYATTGLNTIEYSLVVEISSDSQ